jgi:hypothetical protein
MLVPQQASHHTAKPSAFTNTPMVLRVTIVMALVLAVAASLVRTRMDASEGQQNALQLLPAQQMGKASASAAPRASAGARTSGTRVSRSSPSRSAIPGATAAKPVAAKPSVAAADAPMDGPGCRVGYMVVDQAPGKYAVTVTLQNTGAQPVDGWSLRWNFPATQKITYGWNAAFSTVGGAAVAADAGFDHRITAGGRVTFGFTVGPKRPVPPATGFALNGVTCS